MKNFRRWLVLAFLPVMFCPGGDSLATDLVGGEQPNLLPPEEALKKFRLHPDYEINLFASEVDFPIHSPAAMTFDSKGRLWVGNIPTQPHMKPGEPLKDSVIILEDTDRDGAADRHKVFATGLYLPLGFAVAEGGRTVYVTDEPHLVRLRDTDGDEVADEKEIVLSGFGTEDNHHFISAFQWGPDGRLYFGQGLFLNTQVETPYGPVRAYEAAVFRYDPRVSHLGVYASFGWSNVWGIIFDEWGRPFLNDASPGLNYYLSHAASNFTYPKPGKYSNHFTRRNEVSFTPAGRRPSCGNELLLSEHFPEEVRGWYVTNQMKGWHGLRWYQLEDRGSGVVSSQPFGDSEELLTTSDIMFRPTALQIGPDGALYVLDYYNPIVGHTTYSFRDARHIKTHGRVWRITHKSRPLVWQAEILGEPIDRLFKLLEANSSYRTAYFARQEIQERPASEVIPAVEAWIENLSPDSDGGARRMIEALWIFQSLNHYDFELLKKLLSSSDERARAAAFRVLRYWQESMDPAEVLHLLKCGVMDEAQQVRLESLIDLGYFADSRTALPVAARILDAEMDAGMMNAANDTLSFLISKTGGAETAPAAVDKFLLPYVSDEELLDREMNDLVAEELLSRNAIRVEEHRRAISHLAGVEPGKDSTLGYLLARLENGDTNSSQLRTFESLLLSWPSGEISDEVDRVSEFLVKGRTPGIKTAAQAALIRARKVDDPENVLENDQLLALAVARAGRGASPESFYYRLAAMLQSIPKPNATLAQSLMGAVACFPSKDREALELLASGAEEYSTGNIIVSFSALEAMNRIPKSIWPADYLNKTLSIVTVSATPDLKFVPSEFSVPAGGAVELIFRNPDNLYHNLVIVKPESAEKVGLQADMMAADPDGLKKNYVPDDPGVMHWTPQITIGMARTHTLRFYAPEVPGEYPYICTFPGHWRVMRGVMRVISG